MNLFKNLVASLLLMLSATSYAEVVEFNFSESGYTHKQTITEITQGDITITTSKGDRIISPQYYSNYSGVVFWGSNYMTITCNTKAIEKIELNAVDLLPMDADKIYADKGLWTVNDSQTYAVWTNNRPVNELIITPRSHTIDFGTCITSIKIHLTDNPGSEKSVSTPVVTPHNSQIFNDTPVSITTETPGAEIYYTTDGTIPEKGKSATKLYTSPIYLPASATVSAVAIADGLSVSNVGSRIFSVPIEVNSIRDLLSQAKEGIYYTLKCDMLITYRVGSTCWIEDETGALSLFGDAITNKKPESGYTINSVTGRFNLSNKTPEFEYVNGTRFTPIPGDPCEPYEMHAKDITTDHINYYIIIKGATVSPLGNYDYSLTDPSGTITIRNNYRVAIDESLFANPVDVKLFPAMYYEELRYYIAKIEDPSAITPPDPIVTPDLPNNGSSAERAYTVAEATSLGTENFTSNTWVKGYIVGSYPDQGNMFLNPTFGTADATDHGLALADTPDCTDPSKCIKLVNIQGGVKTDLNLKNNPSMMNKYVAVCGMLGSNYSVLMMPSLYTFLTPPSAGVAEIMDDADAPIIYYNLQGIPVEESKLRPGHIYIRCQGSKTTKTLTK